VTAVILLLAVVPLSGCNFVQKLRARDNLNKGEAFTEMKYDAAAQFFEKSIAQDPNLKSLACTWRQPIRPSSFRFHRSQKRRDGKQSHRDL
jgi:hypothetical protein